MSHGAGVGRRPHGARWAGPTCGARGHEGGCLAILGCEGDADDVARRRRARRAALLRAGAALAARRSGRARRGRAAATPARTCATTCSTAA